MTVDVIQPCRKCGAEGNVSHYHGIAINGWVVECVRDMEFGDGSHSTARYPTEAEAIAAWNCQPQASEDVVERVARAICTADGGNPDDTWTLNPSAPYWHVDIKRAKAAIAAMPAPNTSSTGDVAELVDLLDYWIDYLGPSYDCLDDDLRQSAAKLTELAAEVERLKSAAPGK